MNKYPYIPNKRMYAAVMYACKLIRETGYFNKSIRIASETYNVNVDDLQRHVRARQSAGQKAKNVKRPPRKFKWFVVDRWIHYQYRDDYDYDHEPNYMVIRAMSAENARKSSGPRGFGFQNECYEEELTNVIAEFGTKAEADKYLSELSKGE